MKRVAWILLLLPALACFVEEPQKVVRQDLGYSAVFPGTPRSARYNESTPFGEIEWFNTSYSSTNRFDQTCSVEVGTLPAGNQGGSNQEEILRTLREWITWRYPGSITELNRGRGPGFEYTSKGSKENVIKGIIVLRRGRLHHARGATSDPTDTGFTNFLRSFEVDP
ncbi:MAG: hypothetical protein LBB40_03930 [Holophagales bacterium]|jgi:hypothetical protein|nr:hypothetical protein [Holophagales bacterium]